MSLRTQIAANLRVYARTRINEAPADAGNDTQQHPPGVACTRWNCRFCSRSAMPCCKTGPPRSEAKKKNANSLLHLAFLTFARCPGLGFTAAGGGPDPRQKLTELS